MAEHGGTAYRLGGDEFCILARVDPDATTPIVAAASQALTERGAGFAITASYGAILLPQESRDVTEALRLVDQRMYAQKASGRRSPDRQSRDVLLRALQERSPELAERHAAVARLADALGERIGLTAEEHTELRQAAELHDVGKMGIPDNILHKPGPLEAGEWTFVRRHPLIGERIIGAAPALAHAAKLVRSTHERFDGTGYPDGLAGEQIPLGARIIAVCDAFTAMTSPRAYAAKLTVPEAVAELRRCAGAQFDPAVVDAFSELVVELVWPAATSGVAAGTTRQGEAPAEPGGAAGRRPRRPPRLLRPPAGSPEGSTRTRGGRDGARRPEPRQGPEQDPQQVAGGEGPGQGGRGPGDRRPGAGGRGQVRPDQGQPQAGRGEGQGRLPPQALTCPGQPAGPRGDPAPRYASGS
jgi:HD-GYP domain-containing protein (c-di-GMP phosphodiesterase class II)